MAYEYEGKLLDYASGSKIYEEYKAMSQELQEVYRKAKAWDRLSDMVLDEDMTIREFYDEMYGLLKQTGKTDIRIITDPSIRMEDE
ncbi:MAG: hypothetical protein ACTIBY_03060 [Staphylococcus equorum]